MSPKKNKNMRKSLHEYKVGDIMPGGYEVVDKSYVVNITRRKPIVFKKDYDDIKAGTEGYFYFKSDGMMWIEINGETLRYGMAAISHMFGDVIEYSR